MCCGDNYKFHAAGREDIDVMEIYLSVLQFDFNKKILKYVNILGTDFWKAFPA